MTKKLLQGILTDHPNELVQRLNASHSFDRLLFRQDLAISLAHAKMLLNSCHSSIIRQVLGQRATFYCCHCQK